MKNLFRKLKKTGTRVFSLVLSLLLLCLPVLQPLGTTAANLVPVPTAESMWQQVSTIFQQSLLFDKARYGLTRQYGYSSFLHLCAHYVHIQLMELGVNTYYVGGNGNDEYDNYKNLSYSSGGKKIHAYPDTKWSIYDALCDISRQSRVATNILVGFDTAYASSAGRSMGHVCLIHGIIDGYVYFTDNFAASYGGKRYNEGDPVKCTISEFNAFYGRASIYDFEGIIWFEDENITEAVGKGYDYYEPETPGQEGTGDPNAVYEPGQYTVIYGGGMNIRQNPSTASLSLGIVPYNSTVSVTAVQKNWGNVFCTVNGVDYNGWMCLDKQYATRVADLNMIAAERYDTAGKLVSRQWFDTLSKAVAESTDGTTFVLYGDTKLSSTVTLPRGMTLKAANYNITSENGAALQVRGGQVIADREIPLLKNDPFAQSSVSGGKYTYTVAKTLSIKKAALDITDGTAVEFSAITDFPATLNGLSFSLVTSGFPGGDNSLPAVSVTDNAVRFRTAGVPADSLNALFDAYARAQMTVGGVTYTLDSNPATFSPASYAGSVYGGKDAALNRVVASMMNFSAAAQTLDGTEEEQLANRILPESARRLTYENTALVSAVGAPASQSALNTHVSRISLQTDGKVGLRFALNAKPGNNVRLLVFSPEKYAELKARGGDTAALMTQENATALLFPEADGSFLFDTLTVKEYADTWFFRLCDTGSGACDYVFSASVTDYCAALLAASSDDDVQYYCRALCEYSAAVRTYFNYTINGGKIQ